MLVMWSPFSLMPMGYDKIIYLAWSDVYFFPDKVKFSREAMADCPTHPRSIQILLELILE